VQNLIPATDFISNIQELQSLFSFPFRITFKHSRVCSVFYFEQHSRTADSMELLALSRSMAFFNFRKHGMFLGEFGVMQILWKFSKDD